MSTRDADVTSTTDPVCLDGATTAWVDTERLSRFTYRVFATCGMPSEDAEILTGQLIWADQRGLSALGTATIPAYVDSLRTGITSATPSEPRPAFTRGGFRVVEAGGALLPLVGHRVMRQVIETARRTGVAAAVVHNALHGSALGPFATLAADQQMIGLAVDDTSPLHSTSGNADMVVSHQAFAMASPAGRHALLLLDAATSASSLARIHDSQTHCSIRLDRVAAADGGLTVDPVATLEAILPPVRGHCDIALKLLWDVLSGVLATRASAPDNAVGRAEICRPPRVSMVLLAVDPTTSMPYQSFTARIDDVIDRIDRTRPANAALLSPPSRHLAPTMARRPAIPLPATLREQLRAVADQVGVTHLPESDRSEEQGDPITRKGRTVTIDPGNQTTNPTVGA